MKRGGVHSYLVAVLVALCLGVSVATAPTAAAATVPDAPLGVFSESRGDRSVDVHFRTPPDGGSRILRFEIFVDDSGPAATVEAWTTDVGRAAIAPLTNLTNGVPYTPRVYAVNAVGRSAAAVSNPAVAGAPHAPPNLAVVERPDGAVRVSWTPSWDNAARVTRYTLAVVPDGVSRAPAGTTESIDAVQWDASPRDPDGAGFYWVDVHDLRRGIPYTATVTATSAAGTSLGTSDQFVRDGADDELLASEALDPDDELRSPDGGYRLAMQGDGNLVAYADDGRALWATGTFGHPGARTVMQTDGNLVVYAAGGAALWSSRTYGNPGAWLALQDDGNLVVHRAAGSPAWSSGQDVPDVLHGGTALTDGQELRSPGGEYRAVAQRDGNLVVYAHDGRVLWHSGTHGNAGARTVMQTDGNLVVYAAGGAALWSSRTYGNPGARLVLQDDGNLVVYRAGGSPAWAIGQDAFPMLTGGAVMTNGQSLRSPDQEYRAVAQQDGNLVVYARSGAALWSSQTHGNPGARTVLQTDGNLVVYARSGAALWSSRTHGNPGAYLSMQIDGNLVLYGTSGRALWTSRSGRAY